MRKVLFLLLPFIFSITFLLFYSQVNAQLGDLVDPTNPTKQPVSLGQLIANGLIIIFGLVAFLAVIVFSIGALRYLTSRGDAKAADAARGTMTGSVIGLIIVLGAASLSGVFEKVFGISLFGGNNKTGTINSNNQFDLSCAFQIGNDCIGSDPRYQSFGSLVTQILQAILAIGALAFFLMLLWGGLRYMLARGDEKAVTEARSTLTSATVGLLLLISALVILRLIAQTLFKVAI